MRKISFQFDDIFCQKVKILIFAKNVVSLLQKMKNREVCLHLHLMNLSQFQEFLFFNFSAKMAQAYDFALDHMGMDFFSYSIWTDYILFLKNVDVAGSYAENQKISQIRKIYHRGIVIPMLNVETLWYALVFLVLEKFSLFDFVVSSLFIKLGKSTLRSNRVSIP